ncbi:Holliday junction resolvase RuvX [Helicobacter sp. 11S03491-1]|uniref:Holliday junction resolvase RuvX n=1 Tax=Helicobacter sp. 11S03491-1 TaxID=1476196 RepID=UPI000BA630B4|nr:Holliday junction resolvase RuvX [Helicobacter sp. 11S03491-1]PAF43035.1 Holliday junction DNA helicase RuvA [Helicobacter sp. 11S03491-1]
MIIACDVGLKRIGLAGYIHNIILPLEPIIRKNRQQASADLSDFLKLKNSHILVVGLPGDNNKDTCKRIEHFIGLIKFEGTIIYVNEDYSSIEAFENMLYMKKNARKQAQKDGRLDSLAACKILERYLKSNP